MWAARIASLSCSVAMRISTVLTVMIEEIVDASFSYGVDGLVVVGSGLHTEMFYCDRDWSGDSFASTDSRPGPVTNSTT
ncbi:hypothetical protein Poly59_57380 [Rubripirellula reticaptiva]|uniref:Uncharacterized protein n=2 Tax=Rubripirellula reticaptiva TaxID=2528013 RepID=A0A5C6EE52_9BACT|nr:hypothetical protein Poly59_57380 [Rubripirellula reticaptiva]